MRSAGARKLILPITVACARLDKFTNIYPAIQIKVGLYRMDLLFASATAILRTSKYFIEAFFKVGPSKLLSSGASGGTTSFKIKLVRLRPKDIPGGRASPDACVAVVRCMTVGSSLQNTRTAFRTVGFSCFSIFW